MKKVSRRTRSEQGSGWGRGVATARERSLVKNPALATAICAFSLFPPCPSTSPQPRGACTAPCRRRRSRRLLRGEVEVARIVLCTCSGSSVASATISLIFARIFSSSLPSLLMSSLGRAPRPRGGAASRRCWAAPRACPSPAREQDATHRSSRLERDAPHVGIDMLHRVEDSHRRHHLATSKLMYR